MSQIPEEVLRNKVVQSAASNLKKLVGESSKLTNAARLDKGDAIRHVKLNTNKMKEEAIKDLVAERGIGTFLDIPVSLARMLPTVKKILPDDKYRDLLYSYQGKLVKADQAAGEAVASKGKFLKKVFTTTDMVPEAHVVTDDNKLIQAFVPKETQRLSAPIDKTKNFAVPMLTLYGVDKIYNGDKSQDQDKKEDRVAQEVYLREMLIEKLATTLTNLAPKPVINQHALEKIARASDLLKQASDKIQSLEKDNGALTQQVEDLQLRIFAKERSAQAAKLTQEMITKGLIKQSDMASQIDYIMGLDDEGFKVLNKTVKDVPVKKASPNVEAVEKLSCLMIDPYIDSHPEPLSLADAILQSGK